MEAMMTTSVNLRIPQVRGFKMVSLNVASLPLHIDEIRAWLDDQIDIDAIAVNETRLDDSIPNNMVKLRDYELVRKDRNKDQINFRVRHDLLTNDTETIAVEVIKTNSKPFAMIIAYTGCSKKTENY